MTPTALWLDTNLAGFDHFFLSLQHALGEKLGTVLTPVMKVITILGEKGWIFFLLALIFMLMADKRDLGVCIFGAVCCGALITNIILKDHIARIRPFENSLEYELWWQLIGSPAEDGFSFPSGHVTACAAGMTAILCMRGKKWIVPSVLVVLLMAISRNYLMAHYPSDVLAAAIIGVFSGVVAWLITQLIFRLLNRFRAKAPVCGFLLDFDIRDLLPFGRRGEASAAKPAPARRRAAEEESVKTAPPAKHRRRVEVPLNNDADMRFDLPGRRSEPSAELPADMPKPRRTERSDVEDWGITAPPRTPAAAEKTEAAKPAASRSAGKHGAAEPAAAKKPARRSGGYQGKH